MFLDNRFTFAVKNSVYVMLSSYLDNCFIFRFLFFKLLLSAGLKWVKI